MSDASITKDINTPPELIYPVETEPETGNGSAVEVAPGVLWLRMPVSLTLPWINIWAIWDTEGWAIVDTGLHSPDTISAWQTAFDTSLRGLPVTRVLCTHMHPDHCGMAGWLAEKFGARLWMSRLEYLACRLMAADTGRIAPEDGVRFYRAAGWDSKAIEAYKARFGAFGEKIYPLPASFHRLSDGDWLTIGANKWQIVVGSGHSPEHACLHCPELKLLISGDQVLPRISSNVSVHPTEPDADPLNDWLTSLKRLKTRIPDDVLVLPAHNSPFLGLHRRLDHLIAGHEQGLERLQEALSEHKRAIDVFGSLFKRPITPELLGMATGETLAHLNHLRNLNKIVHETDADGVQWWHRAAASSTDGAVPGNEDDPSRCVVLSFNGLVHFLRR